MPLEALRSEKEELQREYDILQEDYGKLESEYDKLDEEYDELDKKYADMRGLRLWGIPMKKAGKGVLNKKDKDKDCLSEYERELKELTESIDLLKTWYIPRKKSEILKKKQEILSKKEQIREMTEKIAQLHDEKQARQFEEERARTLLPSDMQNDITRVCSEIKELKPEYDCCRMLGSVNGRTGFELQGNLRWGQDGKLCITSVGESLNT